MPLPLSVNSYFVNGQNIELYVPDKAVVAASYQQGQIAFPYWSQVWPAAKALAQYIALHPECIIDKRVLELAAGLGLPSVVAARYAANVLASDYAEAAIICMQKTFAHHQFENAQAQLLDWYYLPDNLMADVLLLSDVSYDTSLFEVQERVIRQFLMRGTTVIISTPQRLVAKEAIAPLIPFCIDQEEIVIMHNGKEVATSVMVLTQNVSL